MDYNFEDQILNKENENKYYLLRKCNFSIIFFITQY